jgi:hypothetical protein
MAVELKLIAIYLAVSEACRDIRSGRRSDNASDYGPSMDLGSRRIRPDVGAVARAPSGKRIASESGRGKVNDHPATGSGILSGHHAIVLLDESEN